LRIYGVTRIISSPMEHHATLDRLKNLASKGWRVDFVKNDGNGVIDLSHLTELMTSEGKALFTVLYANNETGVINPIEEFRINAHDHGHLIHIDAVQA